MEASTSDPEITRVRASRQDGLRYPRRAPMTVPEKLET